MYLEHHWHSGGILKFDEHTGRVEKATSFVGKKPEWGSVWKQNAQWFAIWKGKESFIFQHKTNKWPIKNPYSVKVKGGFIRRFELLESGKIVFGVTYLPKGLLFSLFDPTYDSIDAETDDFFLFVKWMWEYWESRSFTECKIE